MGLQLSHLSNAPRSLPIWDAILENLGRPPVTRIAKTLDVGASTVHRWNATGAPPRVAVLALFWLTRWGRSQVACQATNDAGTAVGLLRAMTEERDTLRARLETLDHQRQVQANSPAAQLADAFMNLVDQTQAARLAQFWTAIGAPTQPGNRDSQSQVET